MKSSDTITLASGWQLHEGVSSHASEKSGGWKKVELPYIINYKKESHPKAFTLRVPLPESLVKLTPRKTLAINTGDITCHKAEIFANNTHLGTAGSMDKDRPGMDVKLVKVIPCNTLNTKKTNWIYFSFTIQGESGVHHGIRKVTAGVSESIFSDYYLKVIFAFILTTLYFFFGFYNLVLGIKHRDFLYNFYFGIFCLSFSLFQLANMECKDILFGGNILLRMRVDQVSLKVFTAAIALFTAQFFLKRNTRVGVINGLYCSFLALLDIFRNLTFLYHEISNLWLPAVAVSIGQIIYILTGEIKKKNRDAYFMLAGIAVVVAGAINDILLKFFIVDGSYVLHISFLAAIGIITILISNHFVDILNRFEELNLDYEADLRGTKEMMAKSDEMTTSQPQKEKFIATFDLSTREQQLLSLLLDGLSVKDLADELDISTKTVNNHIYNLYRKMGINSLREIIALFSRFQ